MRTNKKLEKRFIVKPEEKIVIALISNHDNLFDELRNESVEAREAHRELYYVTPFSEPDNDDVFKGIARCDEHDVFDAETGKKIAAAKADYKYHVAMMKAYEKYITFCAKAIETFEKKINKHAEATALIEKKLEKYISVEE